MLTNYYTLRALVNEWSPTLKGAIIEGCYSQHKGSLILVFRAPDQEVFSLNASVQAPDRHLFMYSGLNRSRKNVVDVFPGLIGQTVDSISIAQRDRLITLELDTGDKVDIVLYGPRANVFHSRQETHTIHTFRSGADNMPSVRPAPNPPNAPQIQAVLAKEKRLGSLLPLFPKEIMAEVWHRSGGTEDPDTLAATIEEIESDLATPQALIYWDSDRRPLFSTLELTHQPDPPETFSSVDEGVRICARRRLAISRFSVRYDPLLKIIRTRTQQARKSLERVEHELTKPARADTHEKYGHLIMAQPASFQVGQDSVVVQDLMDDGSEIIISMDPDLSAVENAQRYYAKAKASRAARESSMNRLRGLRKTALDLESLLDDALQVSGSEELDHFEKIHASWLQILRTGTEDSDSIPYRRFVLDSGYEVWVGRNAKQNDQLTMRDARKFDLWLHARGVAGSHVVLRLRGREDKPPKHIVEQAAAIAAWFSKARPSALVPVIVVERKYVRKPRKAAPGTVLVEREKVLLIAPGLPE